MTGINKYKNGAFQLRAKKKHKIKITIPFTNSVIVFSTLIQCIGNLHQV